MHLLSTVLSAWLCMCSRLSTFLSRASALNCISSLSLSREDSQRDRRRGVRAVLNGVKMTYDKYCPLYSPNIATVKFIHELPVFDRHYSRD